MFLGIIGCIPLLVHTHALIKDTMALYSQHIFHTKKQDEWFLLSQWTAVYACKLQEQEACKRKINKGCYNVYYPIYKICQNAPPIKLIDL